MNILINVPGEKKKNGGNKKKNCYIVVPRSPFQVLILFPVVQSAALLLFLLPWVTYALYLASSGKVELKHTNISTSTK